MNTYTTSQAHIEFNKLMTYVTNAHEPVRITGKDTKVVMLSEEDFESIQETLYLLSIPNMRELILEGKKELIEQCSDIIDWE